MIIVVPSNTFIHFTNMMLSNMHKDVVKLFPTRIIRRGMHIFMQLFSLMRNIFSLISNLTLFSVFHYVTVCKLTKCYYIHFLYFLFLQKKNWTKIFSCVPSLPYTREALTCSFKKYVYKKEKQELKITKYLSRDHKSLNPTMEVWKYYCWF